MKRDYWLDGPYFWGASGDEWQSACFTEHLDYWTPEHTNAYYPKPYFGNIKKNQEVQSGYLQNAAYLRVKNVQVGYTLPKSWTKKAARNLYVSMFPVTICSLGQVSAPYSTPKHWAATGDRVNYIRCKEPYLSV